MGKGAGEEKGRGHGSGQWTQVGSWGPMCWADSRLGQLALSVHSSHRAGVQVLAGDGRGCGGQSRPLRPAWLAPLILSPPTASPRKPSSPWPRPHRSPWVHPCRHLPRTPHSVQGLTSETPQLFLGHSAIWGWGHLAPFPHLSQLEAPPLHAGVWADEVLAATSGVSRLAEGWAGGPLPCCGDPPTQSDTTRTLGTGCPHLSHFLGPPGLEGHGSGLPGCPRGEAASSVRPRGAVGRSLAPAPQERVGHSRGGAGRASPGAEVRCVVAAPLLPEARPERTLLVALIAFTFNRLARDRPLTPARAGLCTPAPYSAALRPGRAARAAQEPRQTADGRSCHL